MIFRYVPPYDVALVQTPNGVTFKLTETVAEYALESIRNKFMLWRKEWFLDQRQGVPYREVFFEERDPDLDRLEKILTDVVVSARHVVRVSAFKMNYDPQKRRIAPEISAILTDGSTLTIDARTDPSFIVGTV